MISDAHNEIQSTLGDKAIWNWTYFSLGKKQRTSFPLDVVCCCILCEALFVSVQIIMDIAFGILINAPFFTGQITEKNLLMKKGDKRNYQESATYMGFCFSKLLVKVLKVFVAVCCADEWNETLQIYFPLNDFAAS